MNNSPCRSGAAIPRVAVGFLLLGLFSIPLVAQDPASASGASTPRLQPVVVGQARALGLPDRDRHSRKVFVTVQIDLADVLLDGRPAVLGAYVARLDFDPDAVVYLGAEGGADFRFAAPPISTDPAIANAQGVVKLAAVQIDQTGPIGAVVVARATFLEVRRGGAQTIALHLESVATALRSDSAGVIAAPAELSIADEPDKQ